MDEKQKLMVVDDDPDILFTVETLFEEEENIEVIGVESGPECLEKMEKGFEGVVLMDIMMPDMDGWDTIQKMVDEGYIDNVIVAMLTAVYDPGDKRKELEEYVIDYIRKPFEGKDLVGIVKEYFSYL